MSAARAKAGRSAHKQDDVRLRLYIASATPNSARAQQNLADALEELGEDSARLGLEVIDVFTSPKRAITDGVFVTPTLIGLRQGSWLTMIGDLTDTAKLRLLLQTMRHTAVG